MGGEGKNIDKKKKREMTKGREKAGDDREKKRKMKGRKEGED